MKFSTPNDWQLWAQAFPIRADAAAPYISPFKVIEASEKTTDILLYGPIGRDWMSEDGIVAKEFAQILAAVPKNKTPRLRINSPGGNVWDGFAIYNLARERGVETRVDSVAASIAAVILCAGKSESPEAASVMIHKCWGLFIGNSDQVSEFKAQLDKHDDMQIGVFAAKTGKPAAEIRGLMAADKWFTGSEAKNFGIIDTLAAASPASPSAAHLSAAPPQGAAKPPQPQPKANTMKDAIIALLKKRGQTVDENATEDQLQAQLNTLLDASNQPNKPNPAPTPNPLEAELKKIQAQLDKERKNGIERRLDTLVGDMKLTRAERDEYLPMCLADADDKLIATLEKRQPQLMGAEPLTMIGGIQVGNQGARAQMFADRKTPRARFEFLRDNFADLKRSDYRRPGAPQAANTTDAALVTDMLTEGFSTFAQNRLSALRMMTKEVATDRLKPRAILQHRFITGAGTAQTNLTNFEDTNNMIGAEDNRPVTTAQVTSGSHLTNAERNNGVTMAQWVEAKVGEFCDKIAALRNAVILEGTYTKTPLVSAAAAFGGSDLAILWGQLKKYSTKNIALDGEYYAQFLPTDRFDFDVTQYRNRGWDNFVLDTYWTGATANTVGFACNPQAILCGVGLPLRSDRANNVSTETLIQVPDLGITVSVTDWYSNITRNDWTTYDIQIGFAVLDADAGVLIKSA